ncbi:MAG: hypothetical protein IMY77_02805 [Chloroflexi bacterium]|nr:hypothetical protein [Chloroflexota bacterium]
MTLITCGFSKIKNGREVRDVLAAGGDTRRMAGVAVHLRHYYVNFPARLKTKTESTLK